MQILEKESLKNWWSFQLKKPKKNNELHRRCGRKGIIKNGTQSNRKQTAEDQQSQIHSLKRVTQLLNW